MTSPVFPPFQTIRVCTAGAEDGGGGFDQRDWECEWGVKEGSPLKG